MKTGFYAKYRMNQNVFTYENKTYKYNDLFNLIDTMKFHKTGIDCDWNVFEVSTKKHKRAICIAFQETTSKTDWIQDFKFWGKNTKAYKGWENKLKFHTGFFEEYQSARDEILEEVKNKIEEIKSTNKYEENKHEDIEIFVIGWSLGASIAPICCEDVYYTFKIKPIYIGFEGANPCSNNHTRNVVYNSINLYESIMFINGMDIVPRCPPIFSRKLKDIFYYMEYPVKFPKLIRKLISMIKDTEYLHTHVDEAILNFMPVHNV